MSKQKISFLCGACSYQTPKWLGKCPECEGWDTFSEMMPARAVSSATRVATLKTFDQLDTSHQQRYCSDIAEWDRVTGGGIVPGAFLMLTGDPGIGKSTLLLHVAHALSAVYRVIYFSSEESLEQIKQRAERIGCAQGKLLCSDHARLDDIIATVCAERPHIIFIDSLQNCSGTIEQLPGSASQLREAAYKLMRLAKEENIAVIVSGHITKEGLMAGPKMLEHMVDAVFYLQGEDRWQTRILRANKNRFGAVNELGFFQMFEKGLIGMPSMAGQLFDDAAHSPGSVLLGHLEGTRPLILEIQALALPTRFGTPQRVISGIDPTQVTLIVAILEKYLKIKLGAYDIFVKVGGGLKVKGSSADLPLALALLSSYFSIALPKKSFACGELSLTGKVQPVSHAGLFASEVKTLGIGAFMCAQRQHVDLADSVLVRFGHVYELLKLFDSPKE